MKVKEIMTKRNLRYCSPETTLNAAAAIMKESNCGFLPVVDQHKKVVGIVTDRDICLALAGKKLKPINTVNVSGIISGKVHSVSPDESISDALKKMRLHKIGRLVVVNKNGSIEGILSIHNFMNKAFSGRINLDGLAASGESISRTIEALHTRYSVNANY